MGHGDKSMTDQLLQTGAVQRQYPLDLVKIVLRHRAVDQLLQGEVGAALIAVQDRRHREHTFVAVLPGRQPDLAAAIEAAPQNGLVGILGRIVPVIDQTLRIDPQIVRRVLDRLDIRVQGVPVQQQHEQPRLARRSRRNEPARTGKHRETKRKGDEKHPENRKMHG